MTAADLTDDDLNGGQGRQDWRVWQVLARRLGLAILIFVGLIITVWLAFQQLLDHKARVAATVNLSGAQRMMIYNILGTAYTYDTAATPAVAESERQRLLQLIAALRDLHHLLRYGDMERQILPPDAAVLAVYENDPDRLDERMHAFLADATRLAELQTNDAYGRRVLVEGLTSYARTSLIPAVDQLLKSRIDVIDGVNRSQSRWANLIAGLSLVLLALIVMFLMMPSVDRVRRAVLAQASALRLYKQSEAALRNSEARFRDIAARVPGVLYQWTERSDGTRGYTYISPRVKDLFGIQPETLIQDWTCLRLKTRAEARRWQRSIRQVMRTGADWSFEGTLVLPDGRERDIRALSKQSRRDESGVTYTGIILDVTEEHATSRALAEQTARADIAASERRRLESRLAATLMASVEAIVVIDAQLRVTAFNMGAERLFGLEAWQALGRPLTDFVPDRLRRRMGRLMHLFVEANEPGRLLHGWRLVKGMKADGGEFPMVVSLTKVTLDDEVSVTITLRDMTDIAAREAALRRTSEEARAASQAKSAFLTTMSHELRTPLNAIIGFSELIESGLFGQLQPARYLEYVKDIRHSGEHLLALVNDVLDLAKLEAGRYELQAETVSMRAVAEEALSMVATRAAKKGVLLDASPGQDLAVTGDSRALRQMLANLLSNAVKFTPAGGRIQLFIDDRPDGSIQFGVRDSGIGIPAEDIATVLEAFGQGRNARRIQEGGTGLGLAIVKSLIELHGGAISLSSVVGRGTTVTLTLPESARVKSKPVREPA